MPFNDLNIVYHNDASLSQTLPFLQELDYSVVALAVHINGKLPSQLPIISKDKLTIPQSLTVLTRLSLTISDTSQNHRISSLNAAYDIVALRPTNDKAFQLCCSSLDCDIISLDFTQRIPFPIKFKTVASALQRGIRFEISYAGGITGSNDARRNLISGAGALIRATRGRGIILSSEAQTALGVRGPWDVINLATVWGLSQERGKEAICEEADKVVRLAGLKRTSFRGVVSIIEDGTREVPVEREEQARETVSSDASPEGHPSIVNAGLVLKQVTVVPDKTPNSDKAKRKASITSLNDKTRSADTQSNGKPISKREMKRQAKKARLDRAGAIEVQDSRPTVKQTNDKNAARTLSTQHENTFVKKKKG